MEAQASLYSLRPYYVRSLIQHVTYIDFSKADDSAVAKDEDVLEISKRLLAQNKEAYEVLAK